MTALDSLQAGFSGYLLRASDGSAVRPLVRVPPGIDAAIRMDVYRNAYRERLHETLRNDYPVLLRLMGAEAFAVLAYACIDAHRARSPNIRWYGAHLPAVAASLAPWRDDATLADMAHFEWAIGLAFDAADTPSLAVPDLAQVPAQDWAVLGFDLHPSLQMLRLGRAVTDWWLAVQDVDAAAVNPPPPAWQPETVQDWGVWRGAAGVRFRQLDDDEAAALRAAQAGGDFGTLCDLLADHVGAESAAPRAAGLLRVWLESGWVVGLRLPDHTDGA